MTPTNEMGVDMNGGGGAGDHYAYGGNNDMGFGVGDLGFGDACCCSNFYIQKKKLFCVAICYFEWNDVSLWVGNFWDVFRGRFFRVYCVRVL